MTDNLFPSREEWLEEERTENQRQRYSPNITTCTICDQTCKVYTRTVKHGQARDLIALYHLSNRKPDQTFFQTHEFRKGKNCGELAKMEYWGLVEMETKLNDQDKPIKNRGWWRITAMGKEFVCIQRSIPKWIRTYNSQVVEVKMEEWVTIRECLGEAFDYDELMAR